MGGGTTATTTGITPGCYDVTGSVSTEFTGAGAGVVGGTCGGQAATASGSAVNCASVASPLCPSDATTTDLGGTPGTCGSANCDTTFTAACSQASLTINPNSPTSFSITFSFWVPFVGTAAACTAAGGINFATTATRSITVPPLEVAVVAPAGSGFCQFSVTVEKKYIEITKLALTPASPGSCPALTGTTLLFVEGAKSFFGAACQLAVTASGIVNIKPEPATGCPTGSPGAPFPSGSTFVCENGVLSVFIPDVSSLVHSFPISVTTSGVGLSSSTLNGTLCTASSSLSGFQTSSGALPTLLLCPTGPGTATVSVSLGGTFPDTQPAVAPATATLTFLLPPAARVVPYVRWAGEKQVLTKCFGGGLRSAPVEFTLDSSSSATAQATLIPASIGGTVGATGGGEPIAAPSQNTVITVTDANGCATVILFAAGEGQVVVDASIFSVSPNATGSNPLVNEHVFDVFYLKFDHVDMENVKLTTYSSATLTSPVNSLGFTSNGPLALPNTFPTAFASPASSFVLPNPPGSNPQPAGGYPVPLCGIDYVRALVHGYFEIPGDPSGRPASTVAIPGAPSNAASSYVLPAGRWVLPEDWPVLATFAGFTNGSPNEGSSPVSSVFAWDLNSGWVFNPGGERADLCEGPALPTNSSGAVTATPPDVSANTVGPIDNSAPSFDTATGVTTYSGAVSYGPCYGIDATPTAYSTAPGGEATAPNCVGGVTVGIGPFDPTQACTNPYPIDFSPPGSSLSVPAAGTTLFGPLSSNSTFLPNGTLNEWDAPMPPAQVTFNITSGPGFLDQVNKTGLYAIPTVNSSGATAPTAIYPDPFYAEAIPASPLIPPIINDGGYLWDTYGFRGGTTIGTTTGPGFVAGFTSTASFPSGSCAEETSANGGPPQGFTFVTASAAATATGSATAAAGCYVGTGGTPDLTVASTDCTTLDGTFIQVGTPTAGTTPVGACFVSAPAASEPGGINLSNFGSTCPATAGATSIPSSSTSVEVADITGFAAGQTVNVVDLDSGTVLATLTISTVTPGPDVLNTGTTSPPANSGTADNTTGAPGTITFTTAFAGCAAIYQAIIESTTVAVPLAAGTTLPPAGTEIDIITPSGVVVSTTVSSTTCTAPSSSTTLCLTGGAGLLTSTGGLPIGSIIETGPTVGSVPQTDASQLFPANGQGPYPFWQFVPNASSGSTTNPSATVYSDNHGEAIVSLETGIAASVAPVNGACPAGYSPAPTPTAPTSCLLNNGALGVASTSPNGVAFPNVATALAAFSASAPGCIQTSSSGAVVAPTATATSTTPQPAVGATGPLPGQICVNKLGGVEFGAGATLGTTTLNAIADYPYVRGVHPPISSGTITKVFTSMFAKTVTVTPLSATTGCTPGTTGCGIPGPAGTTEFNVVITATDICGNPIVGEPVNVFALGNAGAIVLGALGSGAIQNGSNAATVFTGANGTATLSLEVLNSALGTQGLVIKAVFPLEALERFVTVVPGTSGATATVLYTPGYNMVGGPPGSNFSSVEALFNFNPATNSYGNATASAPNISSAPPTCTGYFAYFAAAMAVSLPVNGTAGQTATCTLGAGWNLVGNPFSTPANIQSGVTAYYWNPTSQSYVTVSQIPTGGAVFIFNDGTLNTVTLTAT